MHTLKPTIVADPTSKDRMSFNSPSHIVHPNQQNKSFITQGYKPYSHKYTNGIGISLKNINNRESSIQNKLPTNVQPSYDGYMQKIVKSNI